MASESDRKMCLLDQSTAGHSSVFINMHQNQYIDYIHGDNNDIYGETKIYIFPIYKLEPKSGLYIMNRHKIGHGLQIGGKSI